MGAVLQLKLHGHTLLTLNVFRSISYNVIIMQLCQGATHLMELELVVAIGLQLLQDLLLGLLQYGTCLRVRPCNQNSINLINDFHKINVIIVNQYLRQFYILGDILLLF